MGFCTLNRLALRGRDDNTGNRLHPPLQLAVLSCNIHNMKRRTLISTAARGLALAGAAPLAAASGEWSDPFAEKLRDDFLGHWRSTSEYSLEVLEAMPTAQFGFRPNEEQRTFGEQLEHLAIANAMYFARFEKDAAGPSPEPPKTLTKDTLREFLTKSFGYVEAVLTSLSEEDFLRRDVQMKFRAAPHTAQDIFLRAYMHTTHHTGQIVTYLRLKGITPPRWRFPPNGDA